MKVLAIDTATWTCSVALWEDGHELAFQEESADRGQTALLPLLVKEVMGSHKIDHLIVNVGPGSFTGIRVGLAFAKGLSLGLDLPLKGLDGFTATYVSLESPTDVLILIEARRQDVFGRCYQEGSPQGPRCLTRKEIEKILLNSPSSLVAGNNVSFILEGLSYKEASSPWQGAQKLAYAFFKNPTLMTDALPFYVRDADVTYSQKSCPAAP